jgi:hypothetical protein
MTPGFLYALTATVFGFGMVLDTLITRWGIWNYGLVEANPIYKILPQSVQDYIFKTAFGSFLDGGLKCIGAGVIASIFYHLGFGLEHGSYLDSLILGIPAIGVYALNLRNTLLILKHPKLVVAVTAAKTAVVKPAAPVVSVVKK